MFLFVVTAREGEGSWLVAAMAEVDRGTWAFSLLRRRTDRGVVKFHEPGLDFGANGAATGSLPA